MMSSEYSYGSIGATLGAVPNRRLVLAAKAIVIGAVAFVVGEVVTFTTFLAGQSVMGTAPHASLGQPGVFRAVALSGAFQALLGVFGLGLGTIIRRSAAAITAYAGLVFVLPVLLHPLPGNVSRFGPVIILGNSVGAVKVPHDMLSPWAGFVVMALYAAVAVTVGGLLLVRRDA
jgi:ABC-2 type transport system permease protein